MTGEQKKQKKEMLVELMSNDLYVPMKIKELAILLQVPKERRQELQEVLDELMLEGKIEVSAKGKYSLGKGKLLTGVFTAHARGFGFVTVEGMEDDIVIPEQKIYLRIASSAKFAFTYWRSSPIKIAISAWTTNSPSVSIPFPICTPAKKCIFSIL